IGITAYCFITIFGFLMHEIWQFYAIAVLVGLFQGGIQALSRSFFARLIPDDKSGEFFGFYNMLGKFAAVLGPFMMGLIALFSGSNRYSILSLIILFAAGALILTRVDSKQGT
ncbi:MAG: MFS transporter, partial [Flexistipes sinusarabici]